MGHSKTDYEQLAARYDAARATPLGNLEEWRSALSPYIASHKLVLDVGAGTGLWAAAFAEWFGTSVIGIEPSAAMRRRALHERSSSAVMYVGGRAEQPPLRGHSCDAAWLSTVVHHIDDLPLCAAGLRRVLQSDAPVLIRNAFSDRADEVPWLRWFPHAREAALRRWPTVAAVVEAFSPAGFVLEDLRRVRHMSAPSLAAYLQKVQIRADSTLASISDADFEQGIAAMESALAEGMDSGPIVAGLDLLVLR